MRRGAEPVLLGFVDAYQHYRFSLLNVSLGLVRLSGVSRFDLNNFALRVQLNVCGVVFVCTAARNTCRREFWWSGSTC